MPDHIFLSYARKDGREHVEQLDRALAARGFQTWRDTRNIDHTQDFTAEIEIGIEQASHVLVCVTPASKEKDGFVRREIQYGLALGKPVIPLRFADIVPHVTIINNEWLDFFAGWESAFERLCNLLQEPQAPTAFTAAPTGFPADSFTPYLNALYRRIVQYLNQTVFSMLPGQSNLISLKSVLTPDAVEYQAELDNLVMPMVFFEQADIFHDAQKPRMYHSFHEAFTHHNGRLLLLGNPGAGKTTTLMAFARDAVARRLEDSSAPLPMLALISTWDADRQSSLLDWLQASIPALPRERMAHEITDGKALLLLDGLDELGSERRKLDKETGLTHSYDPRTRFMRVIPPNGQVLISCRVRDYAAIGAKLNLEGAVTLQPLDDPQMKHYLRAVPELWQILENDDELREVARTPLLLSLFTFAFMGEAAGDLAAMGKGELRDNIFETYIEKRYQHEKQKLHSNMTFPLDDLKTILGTLAMVNVGSRFSRENIFSLPDFSPILESDRIPEFLELATRLNILVRGGNDTYRFIHLLLRDYFAYQYALANLQNVYLYVDWNRITDPAQILGALGDIRAIDPLMKLLRYSKYPDMRGSAAQALGDLNDTRSVGLLIQTLQADEDEWVRGCAAEALGQLGDSRAFEPLLEAFHQDIWVRSRAAEALGRLGDPRATAALKEALRSPNEVLRNRAQRALEKLGSPVTIPSVQEG